MDSAVQDFALPSYLFPEVADQAPGLPHGAPATSLLAAGSAWTVVELQQQDTPKSRAAEGRATPTARSLLMSLAARGVLDVPSGELPTPPQIVSKLSVVVDSLLPDAPDADRAALLSDSFLHLLAFQRAEQLLAATEARENNAPAKVSRAESAAGPDAVCQAWPSADPWDESANAASAPSVAAASLRDAPRPPEAVAEALTALGVQWHQAHSRGCQTDLRVVGTNSTQPVASIPEATTQGAVVTSHDAGTAASSSLKIAGKTEAFLLNPHGVSYVGSGAAPPAFKEWFVQLPATVGMTGVHFAVLRRKSSSSEDVLVNYSRNGVRVGGRWCIGDPVALRSGDVISIGNTAAGGIELTYHGALRD